MVQLSKNQGKINYFIINKIMDSYFSKLAIVSIPTLVSDVDLFVKNRKEYRFYDCLNRLTFGFLFYNRKMHYYSLYISSMRKLEKKYRLIKKNNNACFCPIISTEIPPPTAPYNI